MSSYLTFEEENAAWATPEPGGTGDIIKDAMMKEKLIKCVHCALWVITSTDGRCMILLNRDITAAQDDLRGTILTNFI